MTINAGGSPANVGSTTINVVANTLTIGGAFTNPGGLGLFKTGLGNLALMAEALSPALQELH